MKQRTEQEKLTLLADLINTVTRNAHRNRSTKGEHELIRKVAEQLAGRELTDEEIYTYIS